MLVTAVSGTIVLGGCHREILENGRVCRGYAGYAKISV
jgi:hypothetical protein